MICRAAALSIHCSTFGLPITRLTLNLEENQTLKLLLEGFVKYLFKVTLSGCLRKYSLLKTSPQLGDYSAF